MQIPNTTTPADSQSLPTVHSDSSYSVFSNPLALVQLILSHWWVVVACLFLCSLFGGIYAYLATPIYRATARIEILNDSRVETRAKTQYDMKERSLPRQLLLLNSTRLHRQVRAALAADWEKRLAPPELYVEYRVASVPGSNGAMLDFEVESVNPDYSKAYVSTMIEVYHSLRLEELQEVNNSALLGLKREEARVLEELNQAKAALEKFESQNRVFLRQERSAMDLAFINQLLSRLQSVRLERVLLENQYEEILGADALMIKEALNATRITEGRSHLSDVGTAEQGGIVDDGGNVSIKDDTRMSLLRNEVSASKWEDAQAQLVDLQNQFSQLGKVLKVTHPRMVALQQEIDNAASALLNQNELSVRRFKARYEALKLQESSIESIIDNWQLDQDVSLSNENEHRQMISTVKHLEKKYNLVYGRLLENTGTSESFFLRKIQAPHAIMRPIKPQVIKIIAASMFLGGMIGVGIIIGLEYLKPTPINVVQLERDYHLTLLGQVRRWDLYLPIEKFNPESDIFVAAKGTNQIATETYRRIRLNLLKQFGQDEAVSFTVTSSQSGDGKTFNVANIALPFAWVGKRVLLIDADLRLGNLTRRLLGRELRHGLADWLADDSCDANIHIVKLKHEPISILPAGVFDDSLPEKVNAERLRGLVHSLQQDYDVIVIDTAPVSIFSESLAFCQATGGVLVMMDSLTKQASVQNCLNELRGIRTLGFCVNGVNESYLRSNGYDAYGSYGTRHIESALLYGVGSETPKKKRWKLGA
ncbi:AAA family ATPase [Coraliomargarita sp. SDUM461003]|uniref:AAA family ATPase n=1 Tax=Thalassobacterium maritimum TaxID=3041265 RepID=A0ABU1AWK9_9BACT|nr:AAA family ATPase [Coraliomargarita sp. SDUM461003]MDQ8208543.1 AAA family ATPase [Coraliomargarita sp. SDUM461003]